jgi:hypothetical protein
MTTTEITNGFTGYEATIYTKDMPAISTIKKHLRESKASDCQSVTIIEIDGIRYDLMDHGNGVNLVQY